MAQPQRRDARWLLFLAGYTLAEVEEQIIAAVEGCTSGQTEDAEDIGDDKDAADEDPAEG